MLTFIFKFNDRLLVPVDVTVDVTVDAEGHGLESQEFLFGTLQQGKKAPFQNFRSSMNFPLERTKKSWSIYIREFLVNGKQPGSLFFPDPN